MAKLNFLAIVLSLLFSPQLIGSTDSSYLNHENYEFISGRALKFTSHLLTDSTGSSIKYKLHELQSTVEGIDSCSLDNDSLPGKPDEFTFSTIYITTINDSGKAGVGTGFVIKRADEKILVTCKHCFTPPERASICGFQLPSLSANPNVGIHIEIQGQAVMRDVPVKRFILEMHFPINYPEIYTDDTYDLAGIEINKLLGVAQKACATHYGTEYNSSLLLRSFGAKELFAHNPNYQPDYLTDVFMFGYPYAYRAETLPIVRKGYCASKPNTPIFCLDIATAGGSSGSAVFFDVEPSIRPSIAAHGECKKYIFAGMLYSGRDDLARVISASKISAFIDEKFVPVSSLADLMAKPASSIPVQGSFDATDANQEIDFSAHDFSQTKELNLSGRTNVDEIIQNLVENRTIRSLQRIDLSNTGVSLVALQKLKQIRPTPGFIRPMKTASARYDCEVAQINVCVSGTTFEKQHRSSINEIERPVVEEPVRTYYLDEEEFGNACLQLIVKY